MTEPASNRSAEIFNRDVGTKGGYVYALDEKLSTRLATERWLELMLGLTELEGRAITDIGCGDGTFTVRYWDRAQPRMMSALDPAIMAVVSGSTKSGARPIHFVAADGHHLPYGDNAFDVAILQAILHHDTDPAATIREAFRVAREIIVLEPNGYSPVLKLMERMSPYHREHEERSYTSARLRGWVEAAGGHVTKGRFGITVPMFSPDWMARAFKLVEPLFERLPLINRMVCAVYVFHASRA
ncbi:MAG: class I SAM-dependent methyltransferase [Candidatus Dormibacteraceae bacterium]